MMRFLGCVGILLVAAFVIGCGDKSSDQGSTTAAEGDTVVSGGPSGLPTDPSGEPGASEGEPTKDGEPTATPAEPTPEEAKAAASDTPEAAIEGKLAEEPLKDQIEIALKAASDLDVSKVSVTASASKITLQGSVASVEAKQRCGAIAAAIGGNAAVVENNLKIGD